MKFNLITRNLATDDGVHIKRLHCPYGVNWINTEKTVSPTSRMCQICDKSIYDTEHMDDTAVLKLITEDPSACLKIDLNQANVTVESIYGR